MTSERAKGATLEEWRTAINEWRPKYGNVAFVNLDKLEVLLDFAEQAHEYYLLLWGDHDEEEGQRIGTQITDDINADPSEVGSLRRSRRQARDGRVTPYGSESS